jgi:glutamate racemase
MSSGVVGIFDSGIGGFSVLKEIVKLIPKAPILYFADQAHVPYGKREPDQVREFAKSITDFFVSHGACLVVLGCNTASAASLAFLREQFPGIGFVGMEPAIKPASEKSTRRSIGVLATPGTLQGEPYAILLNRFGRDLEVQENTCEGLVASIEDIDLSSSKVEQILTSAIIPMKAEGIDSLVLGCTHYSLVKSKIQTITGESIRVIDPSKPVAAQAKKVYERICLVSAKETNETKGFQPSNGIRFYTSGDTERFARAIDYYLEIKSPTIRTLSWSGNIISE